MMTEKETENRPMSPKVDKMNNNKILTAVNIKKSYDDKQVLDNINVELCEGELVSILGVSGVGKTTLFNVLSGLTMPDSGNVTLYLPQSVQNIQSSSIKTDDSHTDSNNVYESKEVRENTSLATDITGKTGYLSYMLQKDLLLPHKTVVENVALPLLLSGVSKKEALARAKEHFKRFGLEGTERKYPAELSGGMRQRAALLRTYLCDKKVALLDEPFSALDTLTKASMQQWYLNVMKDIRLSTLFITHDMDEAILLSDRIYIMKGSPAVISGEITVDVPKPRSSEFMLTDEFLEYKRKLREML